MHQLVTILFNKKAFSKADAINTFCNRYVGMEEQQPFDWCVTSTAGKWADEYPDNLLTGKDVIERLEKVMKFQKKRENELGRFSVACPEFVCLDIYSSAVTPEILKEVKRNTDNYCILLVDAHF